MLSQPVQGADSDSCAFDLNRDDLVGSSQASQPEVDLSYPPRSRSIASTCAIRLNTADVVIFSYHKSVRGQKKLDAALVHIDNNRGNVVGCCAANQTKMDL